MPRKACTRSLVRVSTSACATPGNSLKTSSRQAATPATPLTLAAHCRHRRIDRNGSMAFTDGIVRVFSNDLAPLRVARGLGLLGLDLLPALRHFVARRMIWGARAWPLARFCRVRLPQLDPGRTSGRVRNGRRHISLCCRFG
jgi:hypothetical protein